ncbi:TetR/AcrR family transcriptional regulator [Pseudonocardia sp. GCM10023141]|uniref:TetR/AcrR family transcriptional regulator n=1 Tax=Pseudonocardia sp. GCM10023141 TaxID=3252653 RepID=UPI00360F55C6
MPDASQPGSARRTQLLELAYAHVLRHGLLDMSLRPLAEAVGSSPRVLLYLFGSKDGLVQAVIERARVDELALLDAIPRGAGLAAVGRAIWGWLADPEHRDLLRLWVEGYARSLVEPVGAWAGYAAGSVESWLRILVDVQDDPVAGTAVLALLRGALLDLLATGDVARTTAAVHAQLARVAQPDGEVVH